MIDENFEIYFDTNSLERKNALAQQIINKINEKGRFVQLDQISGRWEAVPPKRAKTKIYHAFHYRNRRRSLRLNSAPGKLGTPHAKRVSLTLPSHLLSPIGKGSRSSSEETGDLSGRNSQFLYTSNMPCTYADYRMPCTYVDHRNDSFLESRMTPPQADIVNPWQGPFNIPIANGKEPTKAGFLSPNPLIHETICEPLEPLSIDETNNEEFTQEEVVEFLKPLCLLPCKDQHP
jgi:hypothetical protein